MLINDSLRIRKVIIMLEKVIDLFKSLLEKHYLQVLFSVVLTSLIYIIVPSDFLPLEKFGRNMFLFVIFCFMLFIVEVFVKFFIVIRRLVSRKIEKIRRDNEKLQDKIGEMYDFLNQLQPIETDIINYLVDNNNECITTHIDCENLFYNCRLIFDFRSYKVKGGNITSINIYNIEEKVEYVENMVVNQFKLRDDVYELLRYIKKNTGKISNF